MVFLSLGNLEDCPSPFRQLAGVFLRKAHAREEADYSDAREEENKGESVSARDLSNPKQKIANDQIEERPDNIHRRGRQAFSRGISERGWKTVTRNARHKMRHDIR
jgi:hypothetical protein